MITELRQTLFCIMIAYLSGAIPFSYLVARMRGVDLRMVGSGNIGSANVWRSCGFGPFVAAMILDAWKGVLPTLIALHGFGLPPVSVILVGASAMAGHTFSPYMGFKGGKAVATSAGVLLAIFPHAVIIGAASWFLIVTVTRISSLGSLTAAGVVMIVSVVSLVFNRVEPVYALFACLAAVTVIVLHRSNIQRLLEGSENRVQRFF